MDILDRINKIAKKVIGGTATPWGESQSAVQICRGVVVYSTASHGGMSVAPGIANKLSRYTLRQAIRYGNAYWYEEDCAIDLALYELSKNYPGFFQKAKQRYHNLTLDSLKDSIKHWYPDYPFDKEEESNLPKLPLKAKQLKQGDILFLNKKPYIFVGIQFSSMIICDYHNDVLEYAMKESQYKRSVEKIVREGKIIYER